MPISHKSLIFLLVVLLLFTTSCGGVSGNPLLGVWKLDPGQSNCGSDLEFLKDGWLLGRPYTTMGGQDISFYLVGDASEYIIVEGNRIIVKFVVGVLGAGAVNTFLFKYAVSGNKLTLGSCRYTRS